MKIVQKNCNWCNKEFNALLKEIKRGAAKFCSRSCLAKKNNSVRGSIEPKEIFFSNIIKTPSGCWEYQRINNKGYGRLTINRKSIAAHRFSYEFHFGHIPSDILVCHHCDNPPCVNPSHLFLGTPK